MSIKPISTTSNSMSKTWAAVPPGSTRALMGYIDAAQVEKLAEPLQKNGYGQYLLQILKEDIF